MHYGICDFRVLFTAEAKSVALISSSPFPACLVAEKTEETERKF